MRLPVAAPSDPACAGCRALCCHDLYLPIDPPRTKQQTLALRWRLHFEAVHLLIEDAEWFMQVLGPCRYLAADSMCSIYEDRPQQCRDHRAPYCKRYIVRPWIRLTTPEEFDHYLATNAGPWTTTP